MIGSPGNCIADGIAGSFTAPVVLGGSVGVAVVLDFVVFVVTAGAAWVGSTVAMGTTFLAGAGVGTITLTGAGVAVGAGVGEGVGVGNADG